MKVARRAGVAALEVVANGWGFAPLERGESHPTWETVVRRQRFPIKECAR